MMCFTFWPPLFLYSLVFQPNQTTTVKKRNSCSSKKKRELEKRKNNHHIYFADNIVATTPTFFAEENQEICFRSIPKEKFRIRIRKLAKKEQLIHAT